MLIKREWCLKRAFDEVNRVYAPGGMQSGPQRNRQIESWAQLVGRERAFSELNSLIDECGSINKMSKLVRMTPGSIKKLMSFIESLPRVVEGSVSIHDFVFKEGEVCSFEEDLTYEFKEIKGANPVQSIQKVVVEYIIAFINSASGSIFWGINDEAIVKSVSLTLAQKDAIRKAVNDKIDTIEPSIDPTKIRIEFHPVSNTNNGYVVEVNVPKLNSSRLFYNSSGDTWVRLNGCNKRLRGIALEEHILKRIEERN